MSARAIQWSMLAILSVTLQCAAEAQRFPRWRVGQGHISSLWTQASIVAVGELSGLRELGVETVSRLPAGVEQQLDTLHWCEAKFRVESVIKGLIRIKHPRFVWASVQGGCQLRGLGAGDSVWFLREEMGYLRPIFDGGSAYFVTFRLPWPKRTPASPQQTFGSLLLNPEAMSRSDEDYSALLWQVGDAACDALGRNQCVEQILDLSKRGNKQLTDNACSFLKAQLRYDCVP